MRGMGSWRVRYQRCAVLRSNDILFQEAMDMDEGTVVQPRRKTSGSRKPTLEEMFAEMDGIEERMDGKHAVAERIRAETQVIKAETELIKARTDATMAELELRVKQLVGAT